VDGLARLTLPAAVLFAPLAVYLDAGSVWAAAIATVAAARIILLFQPSDRGIEEQPVTAMFPVPSPPPISELLSLVGAVLCIEVAGVTGAAGVAGVAAALAAIGSATITRRTTRYKRLKAPSALLGSASSGLTLILAFWLTAEGIGPGNGEDGGRRAVPAAGAYWGVFLWPEASSKPIQLVAPAGSAHGGFGNGLRVRLKIPFDGVYWFFRPPDSSPPPESVVAYGSPDQTGFRSTDSTPLIMEAHQNPRTPIELTGFSRIEVVVRNTDSMSDAVTIELTLINSSQPFACPLSAGRASLLPAETFCIFSDRNSCRFRALMKSASAFILMHQGRPQVPGSQLSFWR